LLSRSERGFGSPAITYRIKDWGISRQRYWGTPIPMIHCANAVSFRFRSRICRSCYLSNVKDHRHGPIALARPDEFMNVKCPKCGGAAQREKRHHGHVRRFLLVLLSLLRSAQRPAAVRPETIAHWFPIDQYIGGVEHAILHLIYSRFWTKMMRDLG
jgi:leucyl-tRNA synthetase